MTLTLNITIEDEEMNDLPTLTKLVNALCALAPKPEQPAETDENGYKVVPTEEEDVRKLVNDDVAKAIEESEKRREARTKKAEKKEAPAVTETEVRMALGKLQRTDGGKDKVRAILNGLGAKNFPDLAPAKYQDALALTVKELKAIEEDDE